jgi:hypothetical protein
MKSAGKEIRRSLVTTDRDPAKRRRAKLMDDLLNIRAAFGSWSWTLGIWFWPATGPGRHRWNVSFGTVRLPRHRLRFDQVFLQGAIVRFQSHSLLELVNRFVEMSLLHQGNSEFIVSCLLFLGRQCAGSFWTLRRSGINGVRARKPA